MNKDKAKRPCVNCKKEKKNGVKLSRKILSKTDRKKTAK